MSEARTPMPTREERETAERKAQREHALKTTYASKADRRIKKGMKTETFNILAPRTVEITEPRKRGK